jgi:hypothetical protein
VVSLGFDADGKRLRRKVSGPTKAEVKDKLKALHSELDAGLRTAQGYTVEKAVADCWRRGAGADGQDGRGEPGLASAAAGGHREDPASHLEFLAEIAAQHSFKVEVAAATAGAPRQ